MAGCWIKFAVKRMYILPCMPFVVLGYMNVVIFMSHTKFFYPRNYKQGNSKQISTSKIIRPLYEPYIIRSLHEHQHANLPDKLQFTLLSLHILDEPFLIRRRGGDAPRSSLHDNKVFRFICHPICHPITHRHSSCYSDIFPKAADGR